MVESYPNAHKLYLNYTILTDPLRLPQVCAKELEAGEAIWQAASAAGRSEQMTSSPQGVAFLAGLANVHLVAAALRATVKRRHASLPDDSTFVEASRRCEAALSARDLDTGMWAYSGFN